MYIALSVLAVFALLMASEFGWRKGWLHGEFGRKFVHVSVGSFVAFWPFFMTWDEIRWLSLAFLIVVVISDKLKVFNAIHSVQRPTFGEICFALVVGLLTFVSHSKGIYTAALLQMSLADGFAAIIGTRFGRGNIYHVFGHVKSVIGTTVFIVISLAILLGYMVFSVHSLPVDRAIFGASAAALLENVAPLGLDNLLVPLFIGLLLANQRY
jgi:phytol kinase